MFYSQTIANPGIHGPRVLAYDCTPNNALGMPFSLLTRLEGQALHLAYGDMTAPERLSTASKLIRILAVMENVKFQSPGRLSCIGVLPNRKRIDEADDFSSSNILRVKGFGVGAVSSRTKSTARLHYRSY